MAINGYILPAGRRLTASIDIGTAHIWREDDPTINANVSLASSATFGPYAYETKWRSDRDATFSDAIVNFEQPEETAKGAIGSYDETADGTVTLLAATDEARVVLIVVDVTTAFADGDGAQPTLLVGETGDTDKFAAAAKFTDASVGTITLVGTLAADAALLLTQTAGTGTTEAGSYTVAAIASPIA